MPQNLQKPFKADVNLQTFPTPGNLSKLKGSRIWAYYSCPKMTFRIRAPGMFKFGLTIAAHIDFAKSRSGISAFGLTIAAPY